jgi:ParB-like chromosome segregation protein Spo0J
MLDFSKNPWEFHPVANIFPLMNDDELDTLAEDIEENGLREPIWVDRQGRVIDGRNRLLACIKRLGREWDERVYEGDEKDLVPLVLSLNLHRRHLSTGQRALVAARVREYLSANLHSGDTAATAARIMDVSRRTVMHAAAVERDGVPELIAAVNRDEVAVSVAALVAGEPQAVQAVQAALAALGPDVIEKRAKEIRASKLPHNHRAMHKFGGGFHLTNAGVSSPPLQ